MSRLLGHRAVVVGAGIGGLSIAGALAKYFERVEILERDQLTASPASPHARLQEPDILRRIEAIGARVTA